MRYAQKDAARYNKLIANYGKCENREISHSTI